ncbi:hypothetical protein C9439_02845 [archaeon SCG-AAA382B04]|nr:hypothetical protein C9439_02845 [archaeon SCG-AAA382B04]
MPDSKDAPFLALGIEEDCSIWSDDKDFNEQSMVNVYSTKDLIKKLD